MITEDRKYLSTTLRNIGFAFLTPFGSIIFQWIVFKKGAYFQHFLHSVLVLILGFILVYFEYRFVIEKRKDKHE